jgi:hypothetical protein
MIYLQQIWVSCGCSENKDLKYSATILGFSGAMYCVSRGIFSGANIFIQTNSIISAVIFDTFLINYLVPFRTLGYFGDKFLFVGLVISALGPIIHIIYFLRRSLIRKWTSKV